MPSSVPDVLEKWTSSIHKVTLGATVEEGGTRTGTVTIGGGAALPFLGVAGARGDRGALRRGQESRRVRRRADLPASGRGAPGFRQPLRPAMRPDRQGGALGRGRA